MQIEHDFGCKLWLVHRLDRMTSGLLLLARDAATAAELSEAFRERRVEKFYLALSDRKPIKKQGCIVGDMEKGRRGSWRLLRSREKPAITEFVSQSLRPGLRLFLCHPHSGRTHQIRVALKSVGAPIIGDPLYHPHEELAPDRGYLHAWQLGFMLDGQAFRFRCPPTGVLFDGCESFLDRWVQPEQLTWRYSSPLNQATTAHLIQPDSEVPLNAR